MKRELLIGIVAVTVFAFALPTFALTGIPAGSMSQCDTQMQTFLTNYQIPGATFAIAKNGKLVYMRAFGTANQAGTEATQPYHMFRIASISKPITSIAIMKLVENGQLSLSDKPFGSGGILNADPYFANANITDTRVYNITIQHLLEHSAGWNRDLPMPPGPLSPYPWSYGHSDPISFPLHVTQTLGEANPVTERALIKFLMQKGLNFTPGTASSYSNIGYLVLGEVIEKRTGMTYENYVKQNIFAPLGIYDIRLGKNLLADKQEREGEYNSPFTTLSAYGTGQFVPWQYGGWSIEAMDAHGGWIATARDLVRLLTAVDGFPSRPDILSASTIQTMTTPSATNPSYAKGWSVNSAGTWSHGGSLDGSYSWMVRTSNQFSSQVTWAVIMNKRTDASGFGNAVANLGFGNCVNSNTTFPAHDLFDVPTQNASAMNFSNVTSNSMTVNWTNGDGDGRVLIVRAGGAPTKFPLDGTEYVPQTDLGDGNYVAYSGTENNTTVGNLNGNTNYQFRLYEYKKNVNTGNYALYQLANPASGSQNTPGATSQTPSNKTVGVFRPSNGITYLKNSNTGGFADINMVYGVAGDTSIAGDWNADGKDSVGIYRNGQFYLRNTNTTGPADIVFAFGAAGDQPLAGDWNGDGVDTIGVYRQSTGVFMLRNSNTAGAPDLVFVLGNPGDVAIAGDWNGDGITTTGVFRPSNGIVYMKNANTSGNADIYLVYGVAGDKPVAGDWNGDGIDSIGIYRGGVFYLRNSNTQGFADIVFAMGDPGDEPIAGDWDGLP